MAQPAIAIHKFDSLHAACFNKAVNLGGCAEKYYAEMDSMLHVVYKMERMRLDTTVRKNLNKEQLKWISDRNNYFEKIKTEPSSLQGEDRQMEIADKKANFVRKRVIELLNRLTY